MSAEPLSEVELEDYRADVTGRVNVDQRWGRGDIRSLLATIDDLQSRLERAEKALGTASGYLLNAKIDLETGAPKRTAIQTIEGGLRMVRAALDEQDKPA